MPERYRNTLAPRLMILFGVVLNALIAFGAIDLPSNPMLQVLGGVAALIGVVWFIVAFPQAKP